jgi:hypothetical protein
MTVHKTACLKSPRKAASLFGRILKRRGTLCDSASAVKLETQRNGQGIA